MTKIAFLGLGAMGRRMAARLLAEGHEITVWNRSPGPAEALKKEGASVASSPRRAAQGADFVISMVRDDEASASVWEHDREGAFLGMAEGTIAIEASTLSIGWVGGWATAGARARVRCLDAPLAGSRPQAEAGQLIFFAGGEGEVVAEVEPILHAMGTAVHRVGPVGAGMAVKLAVNSLFGIQLATLAELLGGMKSLGVDPRGALEALSATPVLSGAANAAGDAMLAGAFSPLFPIDLVAKDFGYARQLSSKTPMIDAGSAVFDAAVAEGLGPDNITGIIQRYTV